jgi:hypothetical protein
MTSVTGEKSEITQVSFNDLPAAVRNLIEKNEAKTFIGTMLTSKGVLVLLFSHRFNREFPIVVSGTDSAKVQSKVLELLGLPSAGSERGGQA